MRKSITKFIVHECQVQWHLGVGFKPSANLSDWHVVLPKGEDIKVVQHIKPLLVPLLLHQGQIRGLNCQVLFYLMMLGFEVNDLY